MIHLPDRDFALILTNRKEKFRTLYGSRLYQTHKEGSDNNFIIITDTPEVEWRSGVPNVTPYYYEDGDINYIITSEFQFHRNLFEGLSTINADVMMFTNYGLTLGGSLTDNMCTEKIISAYIRGASTPKHASRCLYCADKLLNYRIPMLVDIVGLPHISESEVTDRQRYLNERLSELVHRGSIRRYPKPTNCRFGYVRKMMENNENIVTTYSFTQ